jgi:hypothetical protein
MQRRQHPRVKLRLPARLRWSAALGQLTEQCATINASRGGLLLLCAGSHEVGHPLWVTFPFDRGAQGAQPEAFAVVVREQSACESELERFHVAVRFEAAPRAAIAGNGTRRTGEKKNGGGGHLALPIRVRPQHIPWHEEAMTLEVSPERLKFRTNREYAFGERLLVSFVERSDAPWSGDEEWDAVVTGIEMAAGSDSLLVTVRRKHL